jgi:hypothetical protein
VSCVRSARASCCATSPATAPTPPMLSCCVQQRPTAACSRRCCPRPLLKLQAHCCCYCASKGRFRVAVSGERLDALSLSLCACSSETSEPVFRCRTCPLLARRWCRGNVTQQVTETHRDGQGARRCSPGLAAGGVRGRRGEEGLHLPAPRASGGLTARGRRRGGATAEGLRSRARAPAMSRGAGVVVVSFIPIHYIIRLE